jgi:hypothetical protein
MEAVTRPRTLLCIDFFLGHSGIEVAILTLSGIHRHVDALVVDLRQGDVCGLRRLQHEWRNCISCRSRFLQFNTKL